MDLVQLPRLDSLSAQTLGAEVLAVARGRALAEPLAEALDELASAHRALQAAAISRLPVSGGADSAASRAADLALDASWSALYDFLSGWSKLPDHANAETAARLLAQLFPDGLKFIQLAFKLEWAESDTRLRLIADHGLAIDIEHLGGAPILEQLQAAHARYGDVLGITSAAEAAIATVTANLRGALADFGDALRHYIVRVAASVRKSDPKTADQARELLAPIEGWQTPTPTKPANGPDDPSPPVENPASPPSTALATTVKAS